MTFENFGKRPSLCSFCSRMKRGVLYATARREGYNVLAMAQHLDDTWRLLRDAWVPSQA